MFNEKRVSAIKGEKGNLKLNVLKKEKYSAVAAAITFLLSLLVCVAMFLPKNVGNILKTRGNPIEKLGISQIESLRGCTVDPSGRFTITGEDPQIIFASENNNIECLEIKIAPTDETVTFEVFTAYADGVFTSQRCYADKIFEGKETAVIDLPLDRYNLIRVDIDTSDIFFESLELYSQQPQVVPFEPNFVAGDYLKTALIPLVLAAIVWFVNKRTRFVESAVSCILKNKFKIAEFIVFSGVAVLAGVLLEVIIDLFLSDGEFNRFRFVFLAGIAELVVVFIRGRKSLAQKPESVFLPVIIILGLVMLFGSPAKHISWDLDSHYPWAIEASYADTAYITTADYNVDNYLDQSMFLPNFSEEVYENDIEYLNEVDKTVMGQTEADVQLAHLPAGIFIAIARFFGASFEVKYNLGRLAYLLVYAFVCYFAIKKIKSGKMILATICLLPTNIFMATNYGYDYWVIAFTILGTSYFVSEIQQPSKPITVANTVIMGTAFALGAIPKLVYITLMCMMFFMKKNWRYPKERQRYYSILIAIFAIVFALFAIRSMSSIGGSGDSRGGAVNPTVQLAGILDHPFNYAKVMFRFMSEYLSVKNMQGYISNFAYLGQGKLWIVFAVMLLVVSLTDANKTITFKIPKYMKFLSVLLFISSAVLIASALYISFTPVGAETINGCQPRYLIPLLAPLLLIFTGQRFNLFKNKKRYNGWVLGILATTVMMETYTQIIKVML